ncbi:MAG TPA: glycoside hydrolase family 30 protein [Arachidicoccus sp.]|nr:glycoside hydrolase family 30 protein [Arachidicoccus sp.]
MKNYYLLSTVTVLLLFACNGPQTKNKTGDATEADQPLKSASFSLTDKTPLVYTTAKGTGLRISLSDTLHFEPKPQPMETDVCVFVDPAHQFQQVTGFGGALTDAAAETFAKLSAPLQDSLLAAYYDPQKGIGYTFGRTNINSCDFSSDSYMYVKDLDTSLSSFAVTHDEQFKIPLIKRVNKQLQGNLKLFASPWSPPAWMKDNHDILHGGHLLKKYYPVWANYFIKFIEAYKKQGIDVWGISVQNEPMATQRWESCIFTAEQERDFIKDALGPTLEKTGHSDIKLIAWDHNRDLLFQRASVLLNDTAAARYIWGLGFHWYETWTKSAPLYANVQKVHEAFPNVNLLFTEGCKEKFDFNKIDDWSLGELYGDNLLNDLNNGITAYCDWNILLDQTGGPNHVGNFCFAPVIADIPNQRLHFTNEFWYIGQFSKFIRPEARRVSTSTNRSTLQATSFLNKNGQLVVVVLNRTDQPISYHLWINGLWAPVVSRPHSIATTVI